jgi:hypothetical protein
MTEIPVSSGSLPVLYVVNVEGDTGDADYTGVTKRITARGAEYRKSAYTRPRISDDYTQSGIGADMTRQDIATASRKLKG